jgi:hypothetical protein
LVNPFSKPVDWFRFNTAREAVFVREGGTKIAGRGSIEETPRAESKK